MKMTIPLPITHLTIERFCKDCKHFKPYVAKCKMFAKKDLVHGKIEESSAMTARSDQKMCGYEGKYFESKVEGEDSY